MSYQVTLTKDEVEYGRRVGQRRRAESAQSGLQNAHGYGGENALEVDEEGACGEMAAAKLLGAYWRAPVNTFKSCGDVGWFQVRTTPHPNGRLIVRPNDRDDHTFILVRGRAPDFEIVGYTTGAAAKREEWLKTYDDRPPAYFVPVSELKDVKDLVGMRVMSSMLSQK